MHFICLWIILSLPIYTFATREFGQLSDGDWQNEEFWSPLWHQGNWQNLDENYHINSQQFQAVQQPTEVHLPYPSAGSSETINQNGEKYYYLTNQQPIIQAVHEVQPIDSGCVVQQMQGIDCHEHLYPQSVPDPK